MKFAAFCGLAWLVFAAPASASGFASFNAGILAHNNADADGAIKSFTLAITAPDLAPQLRAIAFLDRGEAYAMNGDFERAISDYSSSLALTPDDYTALNHRGALHVLRREYGPAHADFVAAIRARPELATAYAHDGQVYMAEQNYEDALRLFSNGLAASWYTLNFYLDRSEAYRASGRYAEAITEDDTALVRDKTFAAAVLERGRARRDSGDLRGAMSDFKTASDMASDDPDFQLALGIAQWEGGQYDDAIRSFKRASGDFEQTRYAFIWLYLTNTKEREPDSRLPGKAAKLADPKWPGPIVGLIANSATADQVFAAAKESDIGLRQCEANFYVGEWQLAQQNLLEGKRLLDAATQVCIPFSAEFNAAKIDLKRLPS